MWCPSIYNAPCNIYLQQKSFHFWSEITLTWDLCFLWQTSSGRGGKVKHLRRLRIPSLAHSLKPQVASLQCLSFQDTVYSSLCSTVGPCCLSILHYDSLLVPNPNPSLPNPATLWQIPVCFLCLWACLFHSWVHLCYILDSTFKWYPMEFLSLSDLLRLVW